MKKLLLILFICCLPLASAILNPATVYCEELGYTYEIRSDGDYCVFHTGEAVDAWDFLEGTAGQNNSVCARYQQQTVSLDGVIYCENATGSLTAYQDLMEFDIDEGTCGDGVCVLGENSRTCSEDCLPSSEDYFCEPFLDGVCDPDCKIDEDPDCKEEPIITEPEVIPVPKEKNFNIIPWIIILLAIIIIAAVVFLLHNKKPTAPKEDYSNLVTRLNNMKK